MNRIIMRFTVLAILSSTLLMCSHINQSKTTMIPETKNHLAHHQIKTFTCVASHITGLNLGENANTAGELLKKQLQNSKTYRTYERQEIIRDIKWTVQTLDEVAQRRYKQEFSSCNEMMKKEILTQFGLGYLSDRGKNSETVYNYLEIFLSDIQTPLQVRSE
ncbi:MAG: hypothetical protein GF401_17585 [Chitinivibrionales bacterium]|nr:hypothetical protein [Chitinivibrionales bacterium]